MSCERGIMGVVNKGKTPARIRPRAEVRSLTQTEKVVLSIDSMIIAYSPGEVKSLRAEMFHKILRQEKARRGQAGEGRRLYVMTGRPFVRGRSFVCSSLKSWRANNATRKNRT